MKKFLLASVISSLAVTPAVADVYFGAEGGLGFADLGAEKTAQTLANLIGSTVTYTEDQAAIFGRFYGGVPLADSLAIEVGYFFTGDLDATYTSSSVTATENASASGFDIAMVYSEENSPWYVKAGIHSSKVEAAASLTISGTTYSAAGDYSGTGPLFGAGYKFDGWYLGATMYSDIGGADGDVFATVIGTRF
jgi:hypothetical protein